MAKLDTRARIVEAAIELFGIHGPYGVTFDDLHKAARVTSATIYRIFGTREALFDIAIKTALGRMMAPATFLMMVFPKGKASDFPALAENAVRAWYASLSRPGLRLLMQAAEAQARAAGAAWLEVTAGHHRPDARRLFESLGYDAGVAAYLRKRA